MSMPGLPFQWWPSTRTAISPQVKARYSVCGECILSSTPKIYHTRWRSECLFLYELLSPETVSICHLFPLPLYLACGLHGLRLIHALHAFFFFFFQVKVLTTSNLLVILIGTKQQQLDVASSRLMLATKSPSSMPSRQPIRPVPCVPYVPHFRATHTHNHDTYRVLTAVTSSSQCSSVQKLSTLKCCPSKQQQITL